MRKKKRAVTTKIELYFERLLEYTHHTTDPTNAQNRERFDYDYTAAVERKTKKEKEKEKKAKIISDEEAEDLLKAEKHDVKVIFHKCMICVVV